MFNPVKTFAPNVPGIMLAMVMGLSAAFLSEHYGAPVMLMALLLGMSFNFMSDSEKNRSRARVQRNVITTHWGSLTWCSYHY